MLFALIAFLMFVGLYCFGLAMQRLYLLDRAASQPTAPPGEASEDEPKGPRLTRLGRPIAEIKLSA